MLIREVAQKALRAIDVEGGIAPSRDDGATISLARAVAAGWDSGIAAVKEHGIAVRGHISLRGVPSRRP